MLKGALFLPELQLSGTELPSAAGHLLIAIATYLPVVNSMVRWSSDLSAQATVIMYGHVFMLLQLRAVVQGTPKESIGQTRCLLICCGRKRMLSKQFTENNTLSWEASDKGQCCE